jgi:hypothetical protein
MSVVSQIEMGLSDSQWEMAEIIEHEFDKAAIPSEVTAGAIVNAYYESSLNPMAIGDGGNSVGLFQLNIRGGGAGMSVEERQDPHLNAQRMIEQLMGTGSRGYLNADKGDGWLDIYEAGEERISEYSARFCRDIERPADKAHCWHARGEAAKDWFPGDTVRRGVGDVLRPKSAIGKKWARILLRGSLVVLSGAALLLAVKEYEDRHGPIF